MGDGVEAGSGRFIQLRCSEWHLQDMRMNLKPFLLNENMQRVFFRQSTINLNKVCSLWNIYTVAVDLILIIARLAIYCGGRFDFDYRQIGYEKKAAEDYRAILLKDVNNLLNTADTVVLSDNLSYIGPYYFETEARLLCFYLITLLVPEQSRKWYTPHHFRKRLKSFM